MDSEQRLRVDAATGLLAKHERRLHVEAGTLGTQAALLQDEEGLREEACVESPMRCMACFRIGLQGIITMACTYAVPVLTIFKRFFFKDNVDVVYAGGSADDAREWLALLGVEARATIS